MNPDSVEMLSELSAAGAEFLVVGAHALAAHGIPRATGDLDVWTRPTRTNAELVYAALARFGAPLDDLTVEDLAREGTVFQIGVPPARIDILTSITAVTFAEAWPRRLIVEVAPDVQVPMLGRVDLLRNKRAVGRPKDLSDVAWLEAEQKSDR
ncbi:MAG: hypothetical protein ACREOF_01950 [Gemmatimonadales bacterium]